MQLPQNTRAFREQTVNQLQQFYQKPIAKVSAELFATIIGVTLLAALAIRPTLLTMSQLLKDIEDRRKTSDTLTKKIAALSTLSTEYPILKNNIALLHAAIPNSPDFDGFMRRIEKIASTHDLIISSLQVTQLPKENPTGNQPSEITQFTVSVNFKGEYQKVRAVLGELLSMDRYVTVESATLNAKRDELEKTNTLLSTINLRAAYYGVPVQTGKKSGVATPAAPVTSANPAEGK